jgi:hypothetical protein
LKLARANAHGDAVVGAVVCSVGAVGACAHKRLGKQRTVPQRRTLRAAVANVSRRLVLLLVGSSTVADRVACDSDSEPQTRGAIEPRLPAAHRVRDTRRLLFLLSAEEAAALRARRAQLATTKKSGGYTV